MLRQHKALEMLDGVEVAAVKVRGDDKHLHSFWVTTTDGDRICICTFGNYLVAEFFTKSEVENMEW